MNAGRTSTPDIKIPFALIMTNTLTGPKTMSLLTLTNTYAGTHTSTNHQLRAVR